MFAFRGVATGIGGLGFKLELNRSAPQKWGRRSSPVARSFASAPPRSLRPCQEPTAGHFQMAELHVIGEAGGPLGKLVATVTEPR